MSRFSIFFLIIFIYFSPSLNAQNSVVTADTVKLTEYAFVPALSYNSDFGLIVGGLVNRFDYSRGIQPYTTFTGVNAIITTQGLFGTNFSNDFPDFQGRKFRLTHNLSLSRFSEDNYFGIGRNEELTPSFADDPELYTFNSFSISSELQIRKALKHYDDWRRLEFIFSNIFQYETPFDNDPNVLISLDPPEGFKGGSTNLIQAGFILELRDDEIRPTKGSFTRILTGPSIRNLGSSYTLYQNWFEQRSYLTVYFPFEMTFANRILFQNNSGDTPYWVLPTLGGDGTLRGFPDGRFINENGILINTELRKWLGKLPFIGSDFGGAFFFDAGRSFSNSEFDEILTDLKLTGGVSGFVSFFAEDFFLRTDLGFSEEGVGFYIGVGFLF